MIDLRYGRGALHIARCALRLCEPGGQQGALAEAGRGYDHGEWGDQSLIKAQEQAAPLHQAA